MTNFSLVFSIWVNIPSFIIFFLNDLCFYDDLISSNLAEVFEAFFKKSVVIFLLTKLCFYKQ